jgi:hypothetical protein
MGEGPSALPPAAHRRHVKAKLHALGAYGVKVEQAKGSKGEG